jgi:hypothetical protein
MEMDVRVVTAKSHALVTTVTYDGEADVHCNVSHEQAVVWLRAMADDLEKKYRIDGEWI